MNSECNVCQNPLSTKTPCHLVEKQLVCDTCYGNYKPDKDTEEIITDSCDVCKWEIFEDDILYLFLGRLICETCYTEQLCHRCGLTSPDFVNTYCDGCERMIALTCQCVAVTWCQSTSCICRDCIVQSKLHLRCEKCSKDMVDDLKSADFPGIVEDGGSPILCSTCSKMVVIE